MTGATGYKPFLDAASGASVSVAASSRERQEVFRSAAESRDEIRPSSPESQHAAGVLDLVLGRTQSAVELLEHAAAADTDRDAALADLAAAYLVRASALDQPIDLIAALDASERALELNPRRLEALFNRALAWQRLSLPEQAIPAWSEYLESEKDPEWEKEAESAHRRLQAPAANASWPDAKAKLYQAAQRGDQTRVTALADRFRQEARTFAEEELLESWADHESKEETTAAAADLSAARVIGRSLVGLSGESMLADTVAGIDQARRGGQDFSALVRGWLAYRDGLRSITERQFAKAEEPLKRAEEALRRAGSPFAAWASYLLIRCAYQRSDYAAVVARARDLLGRVNARKYPVVAARTQWVLGTTQMSLARPAEALESYQSAFTQFARVREARYEAMVHLLLASAYNELGDTGSAWQHRAQALRGFARHRDPERLRVALTDVAFGALDAGYGRAAVVLQTAAVGLARQQTNPELLASSLLNLASMLARARAGNPEKDLAEARRSCRLIGDPSIRNSILADLLLVEGQFFRDKDPGRALAALNQAVALFSAGGRRLWLPSAFHARARVFEKELRTDEAERDIESAIELLEQERGAVSAGEQRASFLERVGPTFDAMVLLQTERGREDLALEYSERRRGRLLLDWLSALPEEIESARFHLESWTRPQPIEELRTQIPDGVAMVVYELLPDRLLVWAVGRGSLRQEQVKIAPADLAEKVRDLEKAAAGPAGELQRAAASLYQVLMAPVADFLRPGETIVFVPEGPLYSVPFGLLFNSRTGRYLIQDRPFAIAPSLSIFAKLRERTVGRDFSGADALVMTDPVFDSSLFPRLPRLSGARQEGRMLRDLYRGRAHLAEGEAADRETLLAGLGRYRILHFGGHALANPTKPLLSSLLLASHLERGDSGVLYMRDVVGPADSKTELAVLSACRSAGGAASPGEGVAGLVWPFFSRGVPMVVASLRDVEDRETARLFAAFYRRLAAGMQPLAALREAQVEELTINSRAVRPSFGWGAFQLYGTVPATAN